MVKVLFVCTGNICRSPTAEGVLRAQIAAAGLSNQITVDSAGTHAYHIGERPDPRSTQTALDHGVDLRSQRARQVLREDFDRFDLLVGLDRGHILQLQRLASPTARQKIALLMDFAGRTGEDVPDPYYHDDSFEGVYAMIDAACAGLLAELIRRFALSPVHS